MITPLILSDPNFKTVDKFTRPDSLIVSEFFANTIQGENWSGVPSTFLRLTGCTLDCVFCDTSEVWRYGEEYSFSHLIQLIVDNGINVKLRNGQHLILTGGSPLKQQARLGSFIERFQEVLGFKPYIEVENEAVLMPSPRMVTLVDCWNNSPKLSNSGMKVRVRYKPEILQFMSSLRNSWFKFVVDCEEDWEEINEFFLTPGLIKKEQIVIMPEGQTREELDQHYQATVEIAVKYNVRMCDRLHVTIWNKKTGV